MKVHVITRKLITPSSPTPPHLQNLKLSCLDMVVAPFHIACVLYYPGNGEDHAERSKKLQKSLAEVLTLFYPLGGRYDNENLSVDCNDKGAEYLEAQVSGCFSQLLNEGELEIEVRNHLVPHPLQPEDGPLLIVQCNMFECGGLAVGMSLTHRVADAFTVCTFLNAWSTACRIGIEKTHYLPSFSFCPPGDLSPFSVGRGEEVGDFPKKIVSKKFVLDAATVSKLKAIANANGIDRPTRVEVVTALVWSSLIRVSQARHGQLRPSTTLLPFNMRGKTAIPTPEYLCGNFASMAISQFMPDDKSKMHLHDFIKRVQDALRSLATDCSKVSTTNDILQMLISNGRKMNEALNKNDVDVFPITSWCRFPLYAVDFGWGKPSRVTSVDQPDRSVLLMDTNDGDRIEVHVSLDDNSILLFQQTLDRTIATEEQLQDHTTES